MPAFDPNIDPSLTNNWDEDQTPASAPYVSGSGAQTADAMLAEPRWGFDQVARQSASEEVVPDEMATDRDEIDDNQAHASDPNLPTAEGDNPMPDAAAPKKRKAEDDAEEPATKKTKADGEDASAPNVSTAGYDNQTLASNPTVRKPSVRKTKVPYQKPASSPNVPNPGDKYYDYRFTNTEYFEGSEKFYNYGLIALDKLKPFGTYLPLQKRDINYVRNQKPREYDEYTAAEDRKVDKSLDDHLKVLARQIKEWTVTKVGQKKPPMRYICYMPGCHFSGNNRREISRHFNKQIPRGHGNDEVHDTNRVYGVPHDDWLLDVNLECSRDGTCTRSWYREFAQRNLGPNRLP